MDQKTQSYITVGSFLVAFSGLGFSFFTRNQDKSTDFLQEEARYRAKIVQDLQTIKELHKNELQVHKNEFNEYKLKAQELNFEQEKKIENLEMKSDHLRNQNEHLHSQTKNDNQVLEKELKNWAEKKFKKKND
jgi:hypothetical protein